MPDVYSIPCECEKAYIGQTGLLIETRVKEHYQHIHLYHPKKSAVAAQHSINMAQHIQLQNASIRAKKSRYMDQINGEATEIKLHSNNMMASP
jgi:hypothetical protein